MDKEFTQETMPQEMPTALASERMEEVVQYLELKNMYYEKFYSETIRFRKQSVNARWKNMELLVDNRERILGIIKHFNTKIGRALEKIKLSDSEIEHYRHKVEKLHNRRVTLANKIVAMDLELISQIDDMKTETIRELKQTQEIQGQIHSFGVGTHTTKNKHESEA